VCSGNIHRSQTAKELLKGIKGLEIRSAGTLSCSPRVISMNLIKWADIIFAMEEDHRDKILQINPEAENRIVVLDISDKYLKDDPKLIDELKRKLSPYFGRIG
jgi:predicted protein tyrosine phosphatase